MKGPMLKVSRESEKRGKKGEERKKKKKKITMVKGSRTEYAIE